MSNSEEAHLVDLVATALDRIERGEDPHIAELCDQHPQWIQRVRDAVQTASELEGADLSASGVAPHEGRRLLGRYRLEAQIGAGSMGAVYTAWDEELERPVAVKLLQSELWEGPEAEARFEREARTLAAIRHRSVVTIHDRGQTDEGVPFLVMELLVGCGLDVLLREAQLKEARSDRVLVSATRDRLGDGADLERNDFRQVASWARDVAAGLDAAHRTGVLHRDVKPSNIFVRSDGTAVLIDFGIASDRSDITLADNDQLLGTLAYMPPEALQIGHSATATTDVYGLGATLYHLVGLVRPFEGSPPRILERLPRSEPPPIQKIRPHVPRELRAIIDQSMSRVPKRRYFNALRLSEDLDAFLNHRPVTARPRSQLGRTLFRLRKSPQVCTGAVLLTIAAVVVGALQWRNAIYEDSVTVFASEMKTLPPSLLTAPVDIERELSPAALSSIRESLDSAVESGAYPALALGYRGLFRFGFGVRERAAVDFTAAHDVSPDPVFVELAKRARSDEVAIDHRPLVAASTPAGSVVRALHLLQILGSSESVSPAVSEEVVGLLQGDAVRDLPGVSDFELMAQGVLVESSLKQPGFDARGALQALYEEALRREAVTGSVSPVTALVRGNYLRINRRLAASVGVLREGVALCPVSSSLRHMLATSLLGLGLYEESAREFAIAQSIRPHSVKSWRNLVRALAGAGEHAAARLELETVDPELDSRRVPHRPKLRGVVGAAEALAAVVAGDPGRSEEIARRTIEVWTESVSDPSSLRADLDFLRLQYLVLGSGSELAEFMLKGLAKYPVNQSKLRGLRAILPSSGSIDVRAIDILLKSLIRYFDPLYTGIHESL